MQCAEENSSWSTRLEREAQEREGVRETSLG